MKAIKLILRIVTICFIPFSLHAAYYDVTFTTHGVYNVGNNPGDNSETIFQGDPDLYFYMGIFNENNTYQGYIVQDFFANLPSSTTNWNYPDRTISLRINDTDFQPNAYVYFALIDEDIDADDLLGDHWLYVNNNITNASTYNNNSGPTNSWNLTLDTEGNGWSSNYRLDYSVQFEPVPIPSAIWLFSSGLIGLIGVARRKKA